MNKKNKIKRFIGILLVVSCVNIVAFWISLKFNSINVGLNVLGINFSGPGNNFVGSLLVNEIVDLTGADIQTITLNWDSKACTKQILGLYYNSQRWNRLRPIDQDSLNQLKEINTSYSDLTSFEWWLYTNCSNSDSGSIFGFVKHTWWWIDYYMVAWTTLDYNNNTYTNSFADSFQLFDVSPWTLLLWFIWDNYGGIWLVWWPSKLVWTENLIGILNNSGSIKSGFLYSENRLISTNVWLYSFYPDQLNLVWTNLFWNLFVRGNVWISQSYQDNNSLTTTTQSEALLFNLSDVNVSTLVNSARKNSSILCRDKWISWVTSLSGSNSDVLCYKDTNLNINLENDASKYWNKTIILSSGNVTLRKSMHGNDSPFELFIDKWNLYLEKPNGWSDLEIFDWEWYPSDILNNNFQAEFLKWVFIVNGLIIWSGNWIVFPHKFVIQGRITSLNSPEPTEKRKQQVTAVLWGWYESMIDLDNIFVRKCSLGWTGSDLTRCVWTWDVVKKPFVIIDNLDNSMKYKLLNN